MNRDAVLDFRKRVSPNAGPAQDRRQRGRMELASTRRFLGCARNDKDGSRVSSAREDRGILIGTCVVCGRVDPTGS